MLGGVGAAVSNGGGYPISATLAMQRSSRFVQANDAFTSGFTSVMRPQTPIGTPRNIHGPSIGTIAKQHDRNAIVYQMVDFERQVLDEGNCGRVTDRGEEACEGVRKGWV